MNYTEVLSDKRTQIFVSLFVWIYTIEQSTYYIISNRVDNVFQLGCLFAMVILTFGMMMRGKEVYMDRVFVLYVLLLFSALWQDIVNGDPNGLKQGAIVGFPIVMYLFLSNYYKDKEQIEGAILWVVLIYGIITSIQGLIIEGAAWMGSPIDTFPVAINKASNKVFYYTKYFLGGADTWGYLAGHHLLRLRAFYPEPTNFACLLLIPIFLTIGLFKKHKKKRYILILIILGIAFFFTMARAGFIAFLGAIVIAVLFRGTQEDTTKVYKKDVMKVIMIPIAGFAAVFLLLHGMVALSHTFKDAEFLATGITDARGNVTLFREETFESDYLTTRFMEKPWGYGISHRLHDTYDFFDTNLTSAPVMWTMLGGFPAVIIFVLLLGTLFLKYCLPCLRDGDPIKRAIGEIFIALTIYSCNVGNWMTPDYIIIVALMVALSRKECRINI